MASPARPVGCSSCDAVFGTAAELKQHKAKMVADIFKDPGTFKVPDDGHIKHLYCTACDADFMNFFTYVRHMHERHPKEQTLTCPGCQLTFPRAGSLIGHIEANSCKAIDSARILEKREEKLNRMTRKLEPLRRSGRHLGVPKQDPDYAATYFSSNRDRLPGDIQGRWIAKPNAEQSWGSPAEPLPAEAKFPPMPHREYLDGYAKVPDLLTGDSDNPVAMKPNNSWASPQNTRSLFQKPPQPASNAPPGPPPQKEEVSPHDPSAPNFDVGTYYSPFSKMFVCPHQVCFKKFSAGNALICHLKSPAHRPARVQCPQCLKYFNSATALVQHTEANGVRCSIKHRDDYRIFLDQLTGGLADTSGVLSDDTVRYVVPDDALQTYDTPQARDKPRDAEALRQKSEAASERAIDAAAALKRQYWETRRGKTKW